MATPKYILITLPSFEFKGGVVSFHEAVLKHLDLRKIFIFEVGKFKKKRKILSPICDQLLFRKKINILTPRLVHVNPSLRIKSFFRDGLFVMHSKSQNIPVLVFWHGWNKKTEKIVERHLMAFFLKTFGTADAFVVLGSDFKNKLRSWGVKKPIYRTTTCVDDELLLGFDARKKWQNWLPSGEIKLLFLARLETEKGIFETIAATKILIDKNYPVSLTIAGKGNIINKIKSTIKENRLENNVRIVGHVTGKAKREIFTESHIYCFPSSYGEGLPTSVLEAMAFGLPVITSSVGGLKDIFINQKMGCMISENSPQEIASQLEKLISNPDSLIAMGKYNADYAKKHFMASQVAKQLLDIYRRHCLM